LILKTDTKYISGGLPTENVLTGQSGQ